MPEFRKPQEGAKQRDIIINGASVFIIIASITLVALLLPEMSVGNSLWLRVIFGVICTTMAFALAYGAAKLLQVLPTLLSAAFIGFCALLTCCVFDVLSAFIIMPFSISCNITIAASLLISLSAVTSAMLVGAAIISHPKIAGVIIVGVFSISALALWHTKLGMAKDTSAEINAFLKSSSLIEAPNPAALGLFRVKTLYYGSG